MQDDTDLESGSGFGLAFKVIIAALAIIGAITIVGWIIGAAATLIKLLLLILLIVVVVAVIRMVTRSRSD